MTTLPPRHYCITSKCVVSLTGETCKRLFDSRHKITFHKSHFPRKMERETRLELATPTLARLCSTTELFPQYEVSVRLVSLQKQRVDYRDAVRFVKKMQMTSRQICSNLRNQEIQLFRITRNYILLIS